MQLLEKQKCAIYGSAKVMYLQRPAHKQKQIRLLTRPRKITPGYGRKCLSPLYELDLPLQLKKG